MALAFASGGGGGASVVTQIFASTLSGSAASFDITGISGAFSALEFHAVLRCDAADVFGGNSFVRFNNDSAANYSFQFMQSFGASLNAGNNDAATSGLGPMECDNNATASFYGGSTMFIPFYASTTTFKVASVMGGVLGGGTNDIMRYAASMWKSTTAINRVTIFPSAGANFVAGSAVALYGLT